MEKKAYRLQSLARTAFRLAAIADQKGMPSIAKHFHVRGIHLMAQSIRAMIAGDISFDHNSDVCGDSIRLVANGRNKN